MTSQEEHNRILVSDFTTFMYQKGYRGKYAIDYKGSKPTGIKTTLRECLEHFIADYLLTNKIKNQLQLETSPPYNDGITCSFQLQFDSVKGFLIKDMYIRDKQSQRNHIYQISRNQQIPGSNAIQGLFPKPKPWDNLLKGKFRL